MSGSIAAKAARGAHDLISSAELMYQQAIARLGSQARLFFPNTVYYLPVILGKSATAVEHLGELGPMLKMARTLLNAGTTAPGPSSEVALASLIAGETIEALRSLEPVTVGSVEVSSSGACINAPISDLELRAWGIQLADGRMPGIAVLVGRAKSDLVAAQLVKELRRHNILCLAAGAGLIEQLKNQAVEFGERSAVIPLGAASTSIVHGVGVAARCAMKFGGHKPGAWVRILEHSKRRIPGFVLALGELDKQGCALALAARQFGFSLIFDTPVRDGDTLLSLPFERLNGADDLLKARTLAEKCMTARGLKRTTSGLALPLPYGPAFENEEICDHTLYSQYGGEGRHAFELLLTAAADELSDGKIEIIGPDLPAHAQADRMDLGIVVKVAGPKIQVDFQPFLERQIHPFLNYASGIQHGGSRDAIFLRISREAAAKGCNLHSIGDILCTRFHEEFGAAVEKVEIKLVTDEKRIAEWLQTARATHALQAKHLASLTDSQVDEFYVCTNCRSFAPNNVSIISPERVSPCGQCNWLDARASYELNPAGHRRPIKLGKPIDITRGIWEGTNRYAESASHGHIRQVSLYSIMDSPMVACGDFECIAMLIPEANGVMVVSHEDTSRTPAGITIETFSSITAGEQIPGVIGIGKKHLLSPKFILAEGGFKRVVWMSSILKETMADDLKAVCAREGDPDFLEKVADEHSATTVEELVRWLKAHNHPALAMERMF